MPRDSGGAYTLPAGNPVVSGTIIASTWANATMDDIGNEMTDSLSRSGNGSMLAPLKLTQGSESNPSLNFGADPLTGRYLASVSDMRDTVNAQDIVSYTVTGIEVFGDIVATGGDVDIDNSAASNPASLFIRNSEGGVKVRTDAGGVGLYQTDASGSTSDLWIDCNKDGAVELYYDNAKKLETALGGINVSSNNAAIRIQSSNSAGARVILTNSEGGTALQADGGGFQLRATDTAGTYGAIWAVGNLNADIALYYNGVKKFETTSTGVEVSDNLLQVTGGNTSNSSVDIVSNNGGISVLISGSAGTGLIRQLDGAGALEQDWIQLIKNGAVELYHNGTKKLETNIDGIKVTGRTLDVDNSASGTEAKALVRNSEGGVQLATNSGSFSIDQTDLNGTEQKTWISGQANAATDLYYNGTKKFETRSNGTLTNGTIVDQNGGGTAETFSLVRNSEGGLALSSNGGAFFITQTSSAGALQDIWISGAKDGNTSLRYNNITKLSTTNTGIDVTGTVNEISDLKLKENLEVIPNALDKVCEITGYTFDMKGQDLPRQTGVIAQDVQAVLPEAVGETDDGTLTVAYGNLVGLLIESVKELKAEMAEIKKSANRD